MSPFGKDLDSLRRGEIDFACFARRNRDIFFRWAIYYLKRWPQTALEVEDLVQEGMIEAWRAVDSWDPAVLNKHGKSTPLETYVYYHVGKRMGLELERVTGWPKKSRGTKPVRIIPIGDLNPAERQKGVQLVRGDRSPNGEQMAVLRETAKEFVGLHRDIVTGIGIGMSAEAIAAHLYADADRRLAYRWDCVADARRQVRLEAKRLASYLDS